jgi:uncharacterized lipoprotein NlpE involved in copper resistance
MQLKIKMASLRLLPILVAFTLLYFSCNERNATETKSSMKNLVGTFSGLIPCADCPGIEVTLSFNPDSSFFESMIYQERNSSFKDSGQWFRDGKILKVNEQATSRYFLIKSDSTISWLDGDKKEIEGPLKEHYILKKK